ncbi:hypothetical protein QTP70_016956 [Hemibagrus guttatus]|uniref:USP domain-containing protein n=1 Tax=Hemibagrus guttatus TaxID=175788 RepID=A0AAE0R9F9_9TELE|nr:hypothetical protein QTP70_016956 [Hemibagrus guttatus]
MRELSNFGNNCYINASLQFLFRAETFCQELSTLLEDYIYRPEARLLSYFVSLWKVRNTSDAGISKDILHLALINEISAINPEFTIHKPNDAHDFLHQFLVEMEKSGRELGWQNDVDPRCPGRSHFKFKMRTIITCSSCGTQAENKLKESYYLPVPLVHSTVDQCLDKAVNKQEVLESECSMCGGRFASFSRTFETLPKFLILLFNRVKKTKDCKLVKVMKPVVITPKLHINTPEQRLIKFVCAFLLHVENRKAEARETGSEKNLGGPTSTYRLISVMSHVGTSADYGHFVSDCSSHRAHQWVTYNDLEVTQTTEKDILEKRLSDAYVLLYERVSTG